MVDFFSPKYSLKARMTWTTLAIFLASLWSLSYYANLLILRKMEDALGEQQFSTVSVVAAQLNTALEARINALEIVARQISPAMERGSRSVQALLDQRPLLTELFNAGVLAAGADGRAIAESPAVGDRINFNYKGFDGLVQSLKEGRPVVSGPVLGPKLNSPVFGVLVPVRNAQGQIVGALGGVTDLGKPSFLDAVTQAVYGRTGGFMVVAIRERQIVTATDRRRSLEQLPAPGVNALVDRFLTGYEGPGVIVNPQGVEVLAAAKRIPLSNWYVAAALPTVEAFAPIHDVRRKVLEATLLLTVLAGLLSWWVIKRQLAPMLDATRTLSGVAAQGAPFKPLVPQGGDEIASLIASFNALLTTLETRTRALEQSERKLSEILENLDCVIYVKDQDGRYLFANRQLCQLFGVSDQAILGMSDEAFFEADSVAQLRHNDRRVMTEGATLRIDETLKMRTGRLLTTLSVKLPLRNEHGEVYALCGISTDISERKRVEESLRIAAISFECQEGIFVMDRNFGVLSVNQSFCRITGFSLDDASSVIQQFIRGPLNPAATDASFWPDLTQKGAWKGEIELRRATGEPFFALATVTAVKNEGGELTHYVCNFVDSTSSRLLEQQRLANEAAHRTALVREVHHRINNNLQGILGILRRYVLQHPESKEPISQVMGQVQSVAVIHGLQGRTNLSQVRLCELTTAVASGVESLWGTPFCVDLPAPWSPCLLASSEAVPIALVLNELMLNAAKHGAQSQEAVRVQLCKGEDECTVQILISNKGQWAPSMDTHQHLGLDLVDTLMPRRGARLTRRCAADSVHTLLELKSPVISLESSQV